jgi:hypothetical protein
LVQQTASQIRYVRLLLSFYSMYITIILIIIVVVVVAIKLSLGGSSPYTSTDKTNKNKYT